MKLEIKPEPLPEERKAIESALARLLAASPRLRSAWREAGVRENTEPEPRSEAQSSFQNDHALASTASRPVLHFETGSKLRRAPGGGPARPGRSRARRPT
jgi:hypothetical protein